MKANIFCCPTQKTGEKKIPLNGEAIEVLNAIPRIAGNGFVFAGTNGNPYTALQKDWVKIRTALGLLDVRLHDLRHSFASILAAQGASLLMIGQLLGHADPKTTQIYAHLVDKQQLDATNQVGKFLSNL